MSLVKTKGVLIAIQASPEQLSQILKEQGYVNIINENPNAIIVLCQDNTVRILQDASKGLYLPGGLAGGGTA